MNPTLPNILTVARLLAAPAFALVYVLMPRPLADWAALVLFVAAAATDYLDGYLARRWDQVSGFGRMLDPIADKAMVVIALAVLMGLSGLDPVVLLPAAAILFREVFVSGLREFLGADAGRLKVTKLAKWKTTVQMVAIPLLLAGGSLQISGGPLAGFVWGAGLILLWLAAALTLVTGFDYFKKSLPYLREAKE